MIHLIFRAASAFGALSVAALVAVTATSVFARYLLGTPIAWTEEVSGLLMIWIVMIGAIACEANRQHLSIDLLETRLSPPARRLLVGAVTLASVGLLVWMGWEAWQLGQTTAFKKTQILGVSWFWLDLAVVVGALGTAFVMLVGLFRPMEIERDPSEFEAPLLDRWDAK
jgi:TRAP-type C4-dicarboxylate transport system permease small subunit